MNYLIEGLIYCAKSLLFAIPLYLVYILYLKSKKYVRRERYVIDYLFLAYVIFILFVTGIIGTHWHFNLSMLSFNLRPFANEELKLIVLNILVFMPMGAFIAYYCGEKRRLFYAFVIGFCLTVAIELIQLFFIGRLADVDDVIANTIGCVSGYFAFLLCCSIPLNRDEFYGRVIILSALSLLWGIRYKYYCAGDILLYNMGMEFATQVSKLHYSEIVSMFLSLIGVDIAYRNKMKKKYSCLIIAVLSFVVAVINFIR